jgi:hypothetical protein
MILKDPNIVDPKNRKRSGSRSVLAVSSFRFRARLDVSIPSAFSGQRGYYPPLLDMAPLI